MMSKYNSLVKKAEFYEKLALYGDRKNFLSAIAQATPSVGGTPEAEQYLQELSLNSPAPPPSQTTSEITIEAPKTIDPEIQNMLNHILDKQIVPLMNDGVLGSKTKDALKKFIAKYGPATRANITNVFNKLNALPAPEPGAPLPPMGGGLPSVVPSTRSSGIGEHAGKESGNFKPIT